MVPTFKKVLALTGIALSSHALTATAIPQYQSENPWYMDAQNHLQEQQKKIGLKAPKVKNIILFVGDGMGVSTVTAARILEGQQNGHPGEENYLSFESMPFTGLSKTYNVNAQTPDSAGTMTAMMTGVKTDAGIIGIDEAVVRGHCKTGQGHELTTALELAEIAGKSTGIVTTARITHATPAATYAKAAERNWEDNTQVPKSAVELGCADIADQLVHFKENLQIRYPNAKNINGLEVAFGGGRRHFLPMTGSVKDEALGYSPSGKRSDDRNLIQEWQAIYPEGQFIFSQQGLESIKIQDKSPVLGLFNDSHLSYDSDRAGKSEPTLTQMTSKALDILEPNKKGFFLMVEAGRIDHAHHVGNAFNALNDTIELSNAVRETMNKVDMKETLIIVTADHSHVFTISGYPKRGNPILGKVVSIDTNEPAKALDGKPYTTLGYANGLGYRNLGEETNADAGYETMGNNKRQDLSKVNTRAPGFYQEALIPLAAETHGAEDVAIYGQGPGAAFVSGVHEQNEIFHIMDAMGRLTQQANEAL